MYSHFVFQQFFIRHHFFAFLFLLRLSFSFILWLCDVHRTHIYSFKCDKTSLYLNFLLKHLKKKHFFARWRRQRWKDVIFVQPYYREMRNGSEQSKDDWLTELSRDKHHLWAFLWFCLNFVSTESTCAISLYHILIFDTHKKHFLSKNMQLIESELLTLDF